VTGMVAEMLRDSADATFAAVVAAAAAVVAVAVVAASSAFRPGGGR